MSNVKWNMSLVDLGEFERLTEISPYNLINNVNRYAAIMLKDLNVEGLRMLITQGVGLKYCVPIALSRLKKDILAEGDFYPGDLFMAVADLNEWEELTNEKKIFLEIILENKIAILDNKLDSRLNVQFQTLITNS